jgi:hypothetical protein
LSERERRTPFEVRDASGELIATHVRIDDDDGKRLIWLRATGESGLGDLALVDLPLYGIERLGKASTVCVTEGEKCAQALIDAGIPAVGTVTGSSSCPSRASLSDLAARHVVLWADNDDVGRKHMQRVAEGLRGIAASIRNVDWPGAPARGDAWDYLFRPDGSPIGADAWDVIDASTQVEGDRFEKRGLGYAAFYVGGEVTLTLDRIRRSSGDLHGELTVTTSSSDALGDGYILGGNVNMSAIGTRGSLAKAIIARAPDVKVDWLDYLERFARRVLKAERAGEPVVIVGNRPRRPGVPFLIPPMLVVGKPTILFGPEGTGKSFLAAALAASYRSGRPVIGGWKPTATGQVLVLDWEDDEDEWNDRLLRITTGARIDPVDLVYRYGRSSLADETEELSRIVAERRIGLVIIDSVSKAAPPGRDGGDPSDSANRLFAALRYIGGTSLLLDHVTKEAGTKGTDRPYGSVMKPAAARVTYSLSRIDEKDDPDVAHLILSNAKRTSGAKTGILGLKVTYSPDAVTFTAEPVRSDTPDVSDVILAVLSRGALTYAELADVVLRETDVQKDTIRRKHGTLKERGLLVEIVDRTPGGVARWGLATHEEKAA